MDMQKWLSDMRNNPVKKAMPILSFPSIQLMNLTVAQLIRSSDKQAEGMHLVAQRTDAAAAVSMMDLSVEAEAFGSTIHVSDTEVPSVIGRIVEDEAQAGALIVPEVGAGRTGLYVEAIGKACALIKDRPVFAGIIGPFSLAGRLMDVSEAMVLCYDEPDMVEKILEKVTAFLIRYAKAYKAVGAQGVIVAEPLAGLLSPALNAQFSVPYMKRLIDEVQTDDFLVGYHNCGNATVRQIDDILTMNAAFYHFGNAIDMADMVARVPKDVILMGNVSPSAQFLGGTPASIREETLSIMEKCCAHPGFVISSGCDIPPMSPWANIDAFFAAVAEFYAAR